MSGNGDSEDLGFDGEGPDGPDDEAAMLCRRCGDALLDFQEDEEGMQGWCDSCQEWVEPSAEPDEWDSENELEYDVSDLDHARRVRLVALLDNDGTPFVWDPEHRLIVSGDDEEDVDALLDAVGANPDVAFAPSAGMAARVVPAHGRDVDDLDEEDEFEGDDEFDEDEDDDEDDEDDGEAYDDFEGYDERDLNRDGRIQDWEDTPLDDATAEEVTAALEELAVIVRQLRRDPSASVDGSLVERVRGLVARSPAPYGYGDQHWAEVRAATSSLARALSDEKPSDRAAAATRLQRVLPGA